MGKTGAHSVLRWTVDGRTVLRELKARHEGGQVPGEMSALGGTQSAQMTPSKTLCTLRAPALSGRLLLQHLQVESPRLGGKRSPLTVRRRMSSRARI